jgi:hypothetical protein
MVVISLKTFNGEVPVDKCFFLNFEQKLNSIQSTLIINSNNNRLVGMNALPHRFWSLNNKNHLEWLNETYHKFKFNCKDKFLSF